MFFEMLVLWFGRSCLIIFFSNSVIRLATCGNGFSDFLINCFIYCMKFLIGNALKLSRGPLNILRNMNQVMNIMGNKFLTDNLRSQVHILCRKVTQTHPKRKMQKKYHINCKLQNKLTNDVETPETDEHEACTNLSVIFSSSVQKVNFTIWFFVILN